MEILPQSEWACPSSVVLEDEPEEDDKVTNTSRSESPWSFILKYNSICLIPIPVNSLRDQCFKQVDEEDDDGDEVKKETQLETVLRESKTEKGVQKMPTGKVR